MYKACFERSTQGQSTGVKIFKDSKPISKMGDDDDVTSQCSLINWGVFERYITGL